MTECGADDRIIHPQKLSHSNYTFDYVSDQPFVPQLECNMGIQDNQHGEDFLEEHCMMRWHMHWNTQVI